MRVCLSVLVHAILRSDMYVYPVYEIDEEIQSCPGICMGSSAFSVLQFFQIFHLFSLSKRDILILNMNQF